MIDAKQPLIYFANNSDFVNEYDNTAANEDRNKQAVFVGDNHMIYTHGVAFNGNDTIYSDTELRGLIGNLQDQDTLINGQISTLEGLVAGVLSDLQGLHDWSQEDIDDRIKALLQDAQWLQEHFPVDEIFSQSNFGEDDVKEYLQLVGLINVDENTGEVTTTWSTFQQSYNSLESRVDYLEQNGPDIEGLENRLHQYIEEDTAIADLTSKWFWSHDDDIEWALAGLKTAANNAQSFASVWSAMSQKVNGIDDTVNGTAGLVTKVDSLENNMVAKTELATLVTQAGFATTAGTVSTSGLDGSVAALFSNTSSATNSAVNNKLAGVITTTNLDNAVVTMLAKTGNDATGKQAVINAVANEIGSGITISADKITLDGTTWANTIFADWITANGVSANELHISGRDTEFVSDGVYTVDIDENYINLHASSLNDYWENTVTISPWKILMPGYEYNYRDTASGSWTIAKWKNELSAGISIKDTINQYGNGYTAFKVKPGNSQYENNITVSAHDGITFAGYGSSSNKYSIVTGEDVKFGLMGGLDNSQTIISKSGISTTDNSAINICGVDFFQSATNNSEDSSYGIATNQDGVGVLIGSKITMHNAVYTSATTDNAKIELDGKTGDIYAAGDAIVKGDLSAEGTVYATAVELTSDRTLKDIVSDTSLTVEQVAEAPAVNFTWKRDADKDDKEQHVGTIAQYWQVVLPEVVNEAKNGTLTMLYSNAAMISSIVTAKEVVALKEEIAELKRQIAELKAN